MSDMDRSLVIWYSGYETLVSLFVIIIIFYNTIVQFPPPCYSGVRVPLHLSVVSFLRDRFAKMVAQLTGGACGSVVG
jgi:hypothetical protein